MVNLPNNLNKLELENYFDFIGNYYLCFQHTNKGKEIIGLNLSCDMDPITDVFMAIRETEKPYNKSYIANHIKWLKMFIN